MAWFSFLMQTATPSAAPSATGDGPLGTGIGVLVAVALIALLVWSRRRLDRP